MTFAEMDAQNRERELDNGAKYDALADLVEEYQRMFASLQTLRTVLADLRKPEIEKPAKTRENPLGQRHQPMFMLGGWQCRLTTASAIALLESAEAEEKQTLAGIKERLDAALKAAAVAFKAA